MAATQNILILTSDTGGGHRSAAQALENSLTNLDPGRVLVKMTQVLEEAHFITRHFADLYNYLLRHHQHYMKYYYWAVNKIKPYESTLIFQGALGYGMQLFDRFCPTALVSVHPMTQHFFVHLLKKLRLADKIPLVTVVTDPCDGFWEGWACPDVQKYYVATDAARRQLIEYGIEDSRIEISGLPVHQRFYPAEESLRREYRQMLGLDPDKFTVFLNAGWIGGGNIPKIYEALLASDIGKHPNIQAVFLAGQNEPLIREGQAMAQAADFPVKVLGFSNEIEKIMNASDIMVSKLGGLTTFEALACQLPILGDTITPPMPQEARTTDFLRDSGAGALLYKPEDIIPALESLLQSPERHQAMRQAALYHGRPGASKRIAEDVLAEIEAGFRGKIRKG